MRRPTVLLLTLLALALTGAPALAARARPKPSRHSKPAHQPVRVAIRLGLDGVFVVHHRAVAVPGRALRLTGIARPYVAGQHLTVRAYLGRRLVSTRRLRIRPLPGGRAGRFTTTVNGPAHGALRIEALHARTRQMLGVTVRRGLTEIRRDPRDPLYVALVQQRLAARQLYLPQSGHWDLQTELAIDAYHRLLHRAPSMTLDGPTLTDLLDGRGAFRARFSGDGRHAEVDLTTQLLALLDGGTVQTIYPISSGKPSTPTVLGRYQVYRRTPGYLSDGMYYSSFFIRGYAIHGYDPAPDYPASHGCVRLPISDAITVYDWLNYGDWVDVYDE